ncbi:hypothetical protein B0H17DRAFT_1125209 [Mycena rosella]|uniref:Oxidase ustYa n=1 Tax=Mycena rosella TaxID=1033263 RepID=A0AAD7GXL3_MYCRO|nr:hypothetical protein B0H17DRAFT_1125209 [Mycena rosella]
MVKLPSPSALEVAWAGLLLSISLNISAIYVFRRQPAPCARPGPVDDSRFSYKGDDYPHELPLYIPPVALAIEDSERYGLSDLNAYADWRTTDLFPRSNGFVKLGLEGIAMFHQMHCLQRIRSALVQGDPGHHTRHCLNLLRQTVLCASDTTLDPLNSAKGTDGLGIVHVCRDWQKVYDFVEENQLRYMNTSKSGR